MTDWLMKVFAPRGTWGFLWRLMVLTGIVALANFAFGRVIEDQLHSPSYYIGHAAFVGGPLIAFFLMVTVYQVRLQRKLLNLSRKDALTGLNNRGYFLESVEATRKTDGRGVLLLIDADHFKLINDNHGHLTGDRCLRAIARTIRYGVRREDIVGRMGGEEFAIYLRATTREHARTIGERLTQPITFRNLADTPLTITLSIGAVVARPGEDLDDIYARADTALYDAKLEGRARLVFALPRMAA